MPRAHVFAPLPPSFMPNDRAQTVEDVAAFLGEMGSFLNEFEMIHSSHPDRFFDLAATEKKHLGLRPHSVIHSLCMEFNQELSLSDFASLPQLILHGPQNTTGPLKKFFDRTNSLKCNRDYTRFEPKDVARHLRHEGSKYPCSRYCKEKTRHAETATESEGDEEIADKLDSQKKKVREALIGVGMCTKKRHEVVQMHKAVGSLLNAHQQSSQRPSPPVVAINVGEGRGYVSRVISVCEGITVVGMDCNPQHKEAALERLEPIVDIPSTAAGGGRKDIVNLMYQRRGVSTCVTCRVEADMDLSKVLRGAVDIIDDGSNEVIYASTAISADDDNLAATSSKVEGENSGRTSNLLESSKVQCLACGTILKVQNSVAIAKHALRHAEVIQTHLDRKATLLDLATKADAHPDPAGRDGDYYRMEADKVVADPSSPFLGIPSWRLQLSPEAMMARVLASCFKPAAFGKRSRDDDEQGPVSASPVRTVFHRGTMLTVTMKSSESFGDVGFCTRTLLVTVLGCDDSSGRFKVFVHSDRIQFNDVVNPKLAAEIATKYIPTNESSNFEGRTKMLSLVDLPLCSADCTTGLVSFIHKQTLHAKRRLAEEDSSCSIAAPAGKQHETPFSQTVNVLPAPVTVHTPLRVPSLSNSLLLGLHTCGDLGSNICRMFSRSDAPLLLLVSCCWHALSSEGFPLSSMARSGAKINANALSLMLATQPLDMLGQSGGEEHLGSLRLLFFRSLFSLLWAKTAARIWDTAISEVPDCVKQSPTTDALQLQFLKAFEAQRPQLDRSFLRSLAKDKKVISFEEITARIVGRKLSHDRTKAIMDAVAGAIGSEPCDGDIKTCLNADLLTDLLDSELTPNQHLGSSSQSRLCTAAASLYSELFDTYFIPFVGFTVLRMWTSHIMEMYLLVDRLLFLAEQENIKCQQETATTSSSGGGASSDGVTSFALTPLFDGALSPRMYAIMGLRKAHNQGSQN